MVVPLVGKRKLALSNHTYIHGHQHQQHTYVDTHTHILLHKDAGTFDTAAQSRNTSPSSEPNDLSAVRGYTPLHCALARALPDTVKVLLKDQTELRDAEDSFPATYLVKVDGDVRLIRT